MPSSSYISYLKAHLWRVPLLVLVSIVAATGWYACRIQQVSIGLGYPNISAKEFLVFRRDMIIGVLPRTLVVNEQGQIRHTIEVDNWRSKPRWTPDGDIVGVTGFYPGDTAGRTLIKVELPEEKVVPLTDGVEGVSDAYYTDSGHIIHTETPGSRNENRKFLARIVRDQKYVLDEIEYGDNDLLKIYTYPTFEGSNSLVVKQQALAIRGKSWNRTATPAPAAVSKPAVFRTLDPDTGEYTVLARRSGVLVPNSSRYIMSFDDEASPIFDAKTSEVILELPNFSTALVAVSEEKFVQFKHSKDWLAVYAKGDSTGKVFKTSEVVNLMPYGADNVLIATEQATIEKIDLHTGERQTLFDARPWDSVCRATSLLGLPIYALLWLWMAKRRHQLSPMAEVVIVTMLSIAATLFWLRHAIEEAGVINQLVVLLLGVFLTFIVLWGTNVRSLLGRGLPIMLVGVATTLRLITWRQSDGMDFPTNAAQLNSSGFLIGFLTVSMLVMRRFLGRNEFVEITDYQIKEKQLSLGQIVFLTCGFAVYFGVVRATNMTFGPDIPLSLLYFPAMYGVVVMLACYCSSLRRGRWRFAGLFAFMVVSPAIVVSYNSFAEVSSGAYEFRSPFQDQNGSGFLSIWGNFRNGRGDAAALLLHPGTHPIYVGMLVFAALEYCRRYRPRRNVLVP